MGCQNPLHYASDDILTHLLVCFFISWTNYNSWPTGQEGLRIYRISSTIRSDCSEPPDRFDIQCGFVLGMKYGVLLLCLFPDKHLDVIGSILCVIPSFYKGKECGEFIHFFVVCLYLMPTLRHC